MKKKKTIVICSSASFYKNVIQVEKDLKKLGFFVKIPNVANHMKKTGDFDVSKIKTWVKNPKDYDKKNALMVTHFKKIKVSDAILVVNNKKNNIDGYIGGNVLLEMMIAYEYKKPIYIMHPVSEYLLTEEVYGLLPIFINGDLTKIPV